MIRRSFGILLLVWTSVGLMPTSARAQAPAAVTPAPLSMTQLGATPERIWTIFGHVTTPDGKPAVEAKVRVDIGLAAFPPRALETNIQGNFTTQYTLEAKPNQKLSVEVVATKAGYFEGRAAAEFKDEEGTREFRLVLREETEDPDLLPLPSLVGAWLRPSALRAPVVRSHPQRRRTISMAWSSSWTSTAPRTRFPRWPRPWSASRTALSVAPC